MYLASLVLPSIAYSNKLAFSYIVPKCTGFRMLKDTKVTRKHR